MIRFLSSLALLLMASGASSASAAVIPLLGGDAGEGLTLNPSLVYAAESLAGTTTSLQGVSFATNGAVISYSGSLGGYPGGYPTPGSPTPDDTNLTTLLNAATSSTSANLTVTISGLTATQQYVVNLLLTDHVSETVERELQFSYNGGSYVNAFRTEVSPFRGYNVEETVAADNSGFITVTINSPGYYSLAVSEDDLIVANIPILSAVVVSAVPEPSSLGVMAFAAIALLACGRRRTK